MRLPAFLLVLLVAGCGQTAPAHRAVESPEQTLPSPVMSGDGLTITGSGQFEPGTKNTIVYDRKLVPPGAQASVSVESRGGTTISSLVVEGLLPDRAYGAPLHVGACGLKPTEAGAHFKESGAESSAKNEVWLDLKTSAEGLAYATSRNNWVLTDARLPGSVVLHANPTTRTGPKAGEAGPRVACLSLNAR